MDWLAGKDARGHRAFAASLLDVVRTISLTAAELEHIPEAWAALAAAMESIEEGCQEAKEPDVRLLLANLESAYSDLLSTQLRLIEREPKKTYDKGAVKQLAHSSHADARKRLEQRFHEFISAKQRWSSNSSLDFDETAMGKYKVKDYSRFREEARRVASAGLVSSNG
jgi:hypothetical protein